MARRVRVCHRERMSFPGDQRIREAERAAYHEVGVEPLERRLELVAGGRAVTVRIMEVGEPPAADGPPTVLLLHGVMSASVLFAPLLPYLRQRHVVLVDWPGHGLSGRPSLPHRPDAFRSYTGELFQSMFAELGYGAVDVVGHSLGAQLGLYLAIDDPERVRRLTVLGAPGACLPGTGFPPLTPLMAIPVLGRLVLLLPKPESARRRFADKGVGEGVMETQTRALRTATRAVTGRRANAAGAAAIFHSMMEHSTVRPEVQLLPADLARVQAPVLLVWGEDDAFLSPRAAHASIAAIPQRRLLTVSGGHAPWLRHVDQVGSAIAEFLG